MPLSSYFVPFILIITLFVSIFSNVGANVMMQDNGFAHTHPGGSVSPFMKHEKAMMNNEQRMHSLSDSDIHFEIPCCQEKLKSHVCCPAMTCSTAAFIPPSSLFIALNLGFSFFRQDHQYSVLKRKESFYRPPIA